MRPYLKSRFRPAPFAWVLLIAVTLSGFPVVSAQDRQKRDDDQDTVRLSATLVQVPTVVTDRAGAFVSDLSKNDFAIFEDGKRQEVSVFAPLKQPFNAVLVLDTSNSAQDRLRAIQLTALGFAEQMGEGDRMMVISFDNEVRQLTELTTNRAEVEEAIKGTESGFGKLLYEAVTRALDQLKDVEGRRAVILFSDCVDMRSIEASAESTIKLAEETGAVIYVVRFDTRWWIEAEVRQREQGKSKSKVPFHIDGRIPLPPEYGGPDPGPPTGMPKVNAPKIEIGERPQPRVVYTDPFGNRRVQDNTPRDEITVTLDKIYGEANSFAETLTTRTGGRIFPAETFDGTKAAFAAIADELRNQYLIGYYPAGDRRDSKYRKVKVEVGRKGLQVRHRPGYRPEGSEK
ncbi:MAG TPA: VWA domain-containing protein [Blastocatellia bacterium]|nr:VWA domain-containing protein [Blastocatellia bacterium]